VYEQRRLLDPVGSDAVKFQVLGPGPPVVDGRGQRVARPLQGPFGWDLVDTQHDPDFAAGLDIELGGEAGAVG
jgi:hypothetical protein